MLEIAPTIVSDEGFYRVRVREAGGSWVYSETAQVLVIRENPPDILPPPLMRVYEHTALVRFPLTTYSVSLGTRRFQWLVDRHDGLGFAPAAPVILCALPPCKADLDIHDVELSDAGFYNVEMRDDRPIVSTLPYDIELQVFRHLGEIELLGGQTEFAISQWDDFLFEVAFDGGIPPYALKLLKKDDVTGEFSVVVGIIEAPSSPASIPLEDVQLEDSGEYAVGVWDSAIDERLSNAVSITVVECGEGEGALWPFHTADQDQSASIELQELLRVVQFFNTGAFGCQPGTEDGFAPNSAAHDCCPHDSDYLGGPSWTVDLTELQRLIQFFNGGGYHPCPDEATEDGFCPGASER
jgi:hypothetical protein